MKLVIDTNRIIASLIKDGISRKILFSKNFEFVTPDHSLSEILKYEDVIKKKSNITHEEFEILFAIIFERIEIIPKSDYEKFIKKCRGLISDVGDAPFLAIGKAIKVEGIWSDDQHFNEQDRIRVYNTKDMIKLI